MIEWLKEWYFFVGIGIFMVGFLIAFWLKAILMAGKDRSVREKAQWILEESNQKARNILKEAELEVKDQLIRLRSDFDTETKDVRNEFKKKESRFAQKEENIDKKTDHLERRDGDLTRKEKHLFRRERDLEGNEKKCQNLIDEQKRQLERISGLTAGQAKELLIRAMENEARYEGAKFIKRVENETKEEADKKAKKIIANAIRHY